MTVAQEPLPKTTVDIAVFDNATYVDTANNGFASESDNIQASLSYLGFTQVNPFTGIDAASIGSALQGSQALVIPELENRGLAADLSAATENEIRTSVAPDYATLFIRAH